MKKALLFYFSGTGGTALCASFFAKHLTEEGYSVDLYEMSLPLKPVPDVEGYDLLGFGYPIHAFNTPLTFINFVRKNIKKGCKPYFFFKVSGEPFHFNDSSSHKLYRILKKKGYRFVMEKHFLMPYNIMFRYPDALAKQMYLYLDALTQAMAIRLAKGEVDRPHYPLRHQCLSWLLRIEWIAPQVNSWFTYTKKKKCIHCNLCLKNCPNQAVYLNKKGQIRINNKCSLCMRCVVNCPVDAFHFGFLNNWKVVGGFNYPKLLNDPTISNYHVYWGVKVYFRHFRKYFDAQDAYLAKYGVAVPVKYPEKPIEK